MNRYLHFNLVGILGMGVQLATLSVVHRVWPAHYLLETATALEITLLHNFVWHSRFTWPRTATFRERLLQLVRFHLANGLASLAGNLLLMRLLVQGAHMRVIPANIIAIGVCSLFNFLLSHHWAFRVSLSQPHDHHPQPLAR